MAIYVPTSTSGTTLTELIRLVRMRLGDFPQVMRDVHTGDGEQVSYRLYDQPYEDDGVTATISGTATTSFSVDYDTGWLTFTSAPADSTEIIIIYSCVVHTDEQIAEAINTAIDDCFGDLVVMGENATLETDGTTELKATTTAGVDLDPEDIIERVEYWESPNWITLHDWRINNHSGDKYIHFRRCPSSGVTIRISYCTRPGSLDALTDTLETTSGLPSRAKEPVVLFSCAKLVSQQLSARIHANTFYNAEGNNTAKVYDLRMRIQDLQAEGELALRRCRPRKATGGY